PYHVLVPAGGPGDTIGSTPGVQTADFTQTDVDTGAYAELAWHPERRVELRPGMRVDVFASKSPGASGGLGAGGGRSRIVAAIDPRLAARWESTQSLTWIAALGVAHQASNVPLPSPGLQFSQLTRGLQTAYQYSAGAELKLPLDFMATADFFLHDYTG